MVSWGVVNTQPRQEKRAEINLIQQGFTIWLPEIKAERRHSRRIESVRVPLFPSYLFVLLDPEQGCWRKINSSFGVRCLLSQGPYPQYLPSGFIEDLQKTISADGTCSGLVDCLDLVPGDVVRILTGPFAGIVSSVVNMAAGGERVHLLLDILGGAITTNLPRSCVRAVA